MNIKEAMEKGEAARRLGAFREAAGFYESILAECPQHGSALLGLADSHRGLRDYEQTLNVLARYLSSHASTPSVLSRAGDACRKTGRGDQAETYYLVALGLDPGYRFALMGLGDLYFKGGRSVEALKCWEQILEANPAMVNIQVMAGNVHRKLLDFEKAAQCFRSALQWEPSNPYALFGLADSLRGLGQYAQAAVCWKDLLEAEPDNLRALTRAADCQFRLGDLEQAEALLNQALSHGYDKSALLTLARIQQHRGNRSDAVRTYRTILARTPSDSRTTHLLESALAEGC